MDTVRIEMRKTSNEGLTGVNIVTDHDGVRDGIVSIPSDEWVRVRADMVEHYNLSKATRVDCTNIITALTLALTDR